MKAMFFYTLVIVLSVFNVVYGEGAGSFSNVNPGKTFKDIKNHNPLITQRFSADPGVMVYDGRVYVYATNDGDATSSKGGENNYDLINTLNCMSSSDLVNWTDHGSLNIAGRNGAAKWANNSWAPCATHKTINGKEKFFIYFANSGNGIGVVTSDSPTGPFVDPIGKALVSRQTPNCFDVTWLFDPAVIVDDDGTGYLYMGGGVPNGRDANPKTIRVVKLGDDMISLAGNPETIDAPYSFEDSGINKIGNTYYYSYCTNWANGPYGNANIAYMTSNSPMGPFKFQKGIFRNPADFFGGNYGNNHHTIIEFKDKFYIFYHAEWLNRQMYGSPKGYRTTHVDVLPFSNGQFGDAKGTLNGVDQLENVDAFADNAAASFAWQSGITIKTQGEAPPVNYGRGAWTGVSKVDLGKGDAKSILIKAGSNSGATIKICVDSPTGTALGYAEVPAGASKEIEAEISGATGVKDLFFVASDNLTIESWKLVGNTPAANDNNNGEGNTIVDDGSCWSAPLGFPCCSVCGPTYFTDESGEWGVENDNWCGLPAQCKAASTEKCQSVQGYPCCTSSCKVYFQDNEGTWGIENDDWCVIDKSIC